jgi:hypothetical protein
MRCKPYSPPCASRLAGFLFIRSTMSEHKDFASTVRQILTEEAKSKNDLKKIAADIADNTCRSINKLTPAAVDDMPYARQYTLEQVIHILKDRV